MGGFDHNTPPNANSNSNNHHHHHHQGQNNNKRTRKRREERKSFKKSKVKIGKKWGESLSCVRIEFNSTHRARKKAGK